MDDENIENIENLKGEINSLIGAKDFKKLAFELFSIAPEVGERGLREVLLKQNFLFCIGEGCGLSTYLSLLARVLKSLNLVPLSENPVFEVCLGAYREGPEPFEDAERVLIQGDGEKVGILMVDVSEWLDHADSFYFKQFLKDVDTCAQEFIVVFKIPYVEDAVTEKMRAALCDLVCIRTLKFPPFDAGEMKEFARTVLKEFGFEVRRDAWKYFLQRVFEERSDGKFYGLKTVEKVAAELTYEKLLKNARTKRSDFITASDTKKLCLRFHEREEGLSGEELLNKFIFGAKVKRQIEEIVARIELSRNSNKLERPCIHMCFMGAPGTGKTTAARIIGKILKERGVLRVGNFYEFSGRDLCGRYIGETAPKTQSICRDAYGSVLFIDEAYSLYRGDEEGRDFGREALDTLVSEMENHRGDLVVILAGYTDEMEKLMRGNRGLKSRIPYSLEFENFSREELFKIFLSMASEKAAFGEELKSAAREYFMTLPEEVISSKEFSNGRFVRNLFERTLVKAALRERGARGKIKLLPQDFQKAAAEKEFAFQKPAPQMGF